MDDEEIMCPTCWGSGVEVVCCDDLCQGDDGCIHGDGEIVCPECNGEGYLLNWPDAYEDYNEWAESQA